MSTETTAMSRARFKVALEQITDGGTMSTETQGMSEDKISLIEKILAFDDGLEVGVHLQKEMIGEIRRLQQRERDLLTAVQLNEGLLPEGGQALFVFNDATNKWDRCRAEDLKLANAKLTTITYSMGFDK
jgi:hypothetical protein